MNVIRTLCLVFVLLWEAIPTAAFGNEAPLATALQVTIASTAGTAAVREYSLVVPDDTSAHVTLSVTNWQMTLPASPRDTAAAASTRLTYIGTYRGVPMARLEVRPWRVRNGHVEVARSWSATITFSRPLAATTERPVLPAWMPPLANPGWKAQSVQHKTADKLQRTPDPASWLEPGQPFVRVRTSQHGIAVLTAERIGAYEPRLLNMPLNEVALFHNGVEVPIELYDADNTGTLTSGDRVYFVGRPPIDDSLRLYLWDSTAVFMFGRTTREDIRRRFTDLGTGSEQPVSTLQSLLYRRRIEIDTGFYHLGSGAADRGADFTSDVALFEGFYWHNLVATPSGGGRLQHREVILPSRSAGIFNVGVEYNTLTQTRFKPEHRVELAVNGGSTVSHESSGWESHSLVQTRPSAQFVPGVNTVTVFGPGIRELWGTRDYMSWVGVNALTVEGYIEPATIRGRLFGDVFSTSVVHNLSVYGVNTQSFLVVDTISHQRRWIDAGERGYSVHAGMAPANKPSAVEPWDGVTMTGTAILGDSVYVWDTLSAFTFVGMSTDGLPSIHASSSDAQAREWLQTRRTGTVVVAHIVRPTLFSEVQTKLRELGASVSDAPLQTLVGVVGGAASWQQVEPQGMPEARGGVSTFLVSNNGKQFRGNIVLPPAEGRHLVIADELGFEEARVEPVVHRDLRNTPFDVDVLYLYHPIHRSAAERLAAHRRAHDGVTTALVDVHAIRDEFGAGSLDPDVIKSFLRNAMQRPTNGTKPSYMIIIGSASWDPRLAVKGGNVGARLPDQVPSYGRPSSDYWYGLLDDELNYAAPQLVIGRLPALTAEQSATIVDKIIMQDTMSFEPWMRRFLYVGTGTSQQDQLCSIYENLLTDPLQTGYTVTGPPLCLDTITMCRFNSPASAGFEIRRHLNSGVQLMHFLGHGATNVFEIPAWDAPDLDNAERLGFLATYACQTGSFSNPSVPCKNATYLLEPTKGFVGAIGGTGWAFVQTMDLMHFRIHDAIRTSGLRRIGDVLYAAKSIFGSDRFDWDGVNTAMQQSLLGDPFSRIRIDVEPDPFITRSEVAVTSIDGLSQVTQDMDLAVATIAVRNAGVSTEIPIDVRLIHSWNDVSDTILTRTDDILCSSAMVRCSLNVLNRIGTHTIEIELDYRDLIAEPSFNNRVVTTFDVRSNALVPVEPQAMWAIPRTNVSIRMLDAKPSLQSEYSFVIATEPRTEPDAVVIQSTPDDITASADGVIDWQPRVDMPSGLHWLGSSVRRPELNESLSTAWFPVSFLTDEHRSFMPGRFFRPESATIAINGDTVTLNDPYVRLHVISAGSDSAEQDYTRHPTLRLAVGHNSGNVLLIQNPYYRGFNVLLIPESDSVPRAWRRFDTFINPDTTWTCCINGYANELLDFLRDSVLATDRVVIALCNESMTAFTETGRLEEIRSAIKRFGASLADSLRPNSSYILVGRIGLDSGKAIERLSNVRYQSVELDTVLPVTATGGSAIAGPFGPARRYNRVTVDGSIADGTVTTEVGYRDGEGTFRVLETLPAGLGTWPLTIDANRNPFLHVRTTIAPVGGGKPAIVRGVRLDYVPANEWSLSQSGTIPETLRGDTVEVPLRVRNLMTSYRSSQTSYTVNIISSAGGGTETIVVPVPPLDPDVAIDVAAPIPTARLETESIVEGQVNAQPLDVPELYRFNNEVALALSLREDTESPTLRLEVDEKPAFDGLFVVRAPLMRVLLFDNSKLAVTDSMRFGVFINGNRMRPAVVSDWRFLPTKAALDEFPLYGPGLRAVMQFRYGLDDGQNNVVIRAEDASGNRDTLELAVYVSSENSLGNVTVEPNPVTDNATYVVDLAAGGAANTAVIDVFDLRGVQVATIPTTLSVGRSRITWNALGTGGHRLPSGTYHFRLTVSPELGLPPKNGSFVLQR